jgi:DNA-binding transcriptional MerR regulator
MADGPALTIGEVINLLKDEFPDVTVSKVRFLESQGLIDPARSSSGYRQFYTAEVKRLRYILQQQRDHFLPLKVIKSQLTLWDRGDEPRVTPPVGPDPADLLEEDSVDSVDTEELLRRTDLTRTQLKALVDLGMVQPDSRHGVDSYPMAEVAIARQCGVLLGYGLEPRHLRSMRIGAERNADLLRTLTAALRRNRSPQARREAAETLAGCAEAIGKLQNLILAGQIRAFLHDD